MSDPVDVSVPGSVPARVEIYDTTLRDGSQLEGISLTVDDREIGEPGPITRKIQETYAATVRGQVESYRDWVEHV